MTYDNKTILPVNPNRIDSISYNKGDYVSDGFKLWCSARDIKMKCETKEDFTFGEGATN